MKQILYAIVMIAVHVATVHAAGNAHRVALFDQRVSVETPTVRSNGTRIEVVMTINLSSLKVKHEETITLIPEIATATGDTVRLDPVTIYGRNAIMRRLRSGELTRPLPANTLDATSRLKSLLYRASTVLTTENTSGTLTIKMTTCRKAGAPIVEYPTERIDGYALTTPVFTPQYIYAIPTEATVKSRRRRMRIDFAAVNSAETTDSVNRFIDRITGYGHRLTEINVTALSVAGVYGSNPAVPAAKADSIVNLITGRYPELAGIVTTTLNTDDWHGIRNWIGRSSIQNRDSILAVIDRMDHDTQACLATLKKRYPSQLSFLQDVIAPLLNHVSITVSTTETAIDDVEQIERIYAANPEELSLYELCKYFNYLQSRRVKACDEVMLKGVELYPEDTRARINAANVWMSRGNLSAAQSQLKHAGNSAEAVYARGILYALSNDLRRARECFVEARARGILEAERAMNAIDRLSIFESERGN
ncbi:MAG: DUF3868 domain-containing protein [Muribaculaceae bacterium]|nr:DUF3868 domain-containing protein [Muribaculaceae bacterium]